MFITIGDISNGFSSLQRLREIEKTHSYWSNRRQKGRGDGNEKRGEEC